MPEKLPTHFGEEPKKLAFSVLVCAVVLVLLESAARLLETSLGLQQQQLVSGPGWQAKFFASLFGWHEPDPDFLWRFKANLDNPLIKTNSAHLVGDEIAVEKDRFTFRILLLGDSAPVGIGLKSRGMAFGEVLKRLLEVECGGAKKITLINAAVSGYSSEQIARWLELKGWSYQPDLVVVYCGNNDASISGPYTDRKLLEGQRLKTLRKLSSHLAIYRLLRSVFVRPPGGADEQEISLQVRVPPRRFGRNLLRIADGCAEHACPLLIAKPPVPMLWPAGLQFKVFSHVTGEDGHLILPDLLADILGRQIKYCLNNEMFARLYGSGDKFTRAVYRSAYVDSLIPAQAAKRYTELLKRDPDNPLLLNNLGVCLWKNGQYIEAGGYLQRARELYVNSHVGNVDPSLLAAGSPILFNIGINYLSERGGDLNLLHDTAGLAYRYLDSALQADYLSLRIKRSYWREIDRMNAWPNVTVVDLPTVFREHGGEKLFIDHCHPTAEGHLIIARELFRVICGQFRSRL